MALVGDYSLLLDFVIFIFVVVVVVVFYCLYFPVSFADPVPKCRGHAFSRSSGVHSWVQDVRPEQGPYLHFIGK